MERRSDHRVCEGIQWEGRSWELWMLGWGASLGKQKPFMILSRGGCYQMCTVVKINLAMCTESIGITFEGSNHDFATE